MRDNGAYVVHADMVTPYGSGMDSCWEGIMSGKTALSLVNRFDTSAFHSNYAGIIDGLEYGKEQSLVMQMLTTLFKRISIPEDAKLILATTKGEVDILEQSILKGTGDAKQSRLSFLLEKVKKLTGVKDKGMIISAACASSSAALAKAASMITMGLTNCIVVVACDSVTEFIYSGFSSLMALDKSSAKPFDKDRSGLSVGEASAVSLVMSGSRVKRDGVQVLGEVKGWGFSCDANHMTGPSRDGSSLAFAIRSALKIAGVKRDTIGPISAHGTGTVYNDSMEMKAIRSVFNSLRRPVYSIKGSIGHTMGAAGLIEALLSLKSLQECVTPPTVGLQNVDEEAIGWVAPEKRLFADDKLALSTNSGFGGVNVALVLGAVTSI